jgi:hypothetical protein
LSADGLSLPDFSLVDRPLDDGDLSTATDIPDDVVEVSDDLVVPTDRDGGGGFIQSST